MDKYFVILVGFCLISGACCYPNGQNGTKEPVVEANSGATSTAGSISVDTSTSSSNVSNVLVTPDPKPTILVDDSPVVSNDTTSASPNTTIPTTIPTTTPTTATTAPTTTTTAPTTSPTTTTQAPTIPTTATTATTVITTTTVGPTTTSGTPGSTTLMPTPSPSKDRRFDGPSFIGGIVLSLGIMAIAFVAFKFYKARTERNYHTL